MAATQFRSEDLAAIFMGQDQGRPVGAGQPAVASGDHTDQQGIQSYAFLAEPVLPLMGAFGNRPSHQNVPGQQPFQAYVQDIRRDGEMAAKLLNRRTP